MLQFSFNQLFYYSKLFNTSYIVQINMPKYSGMDLLRNLKKQRPSELKKVVVTSVLKFSATQIKELLKFGIHSVEEKPSGLQKM